MKTESFVRAPLAAVGGRERSSLLLLTGAVPGGVLLASVMLVIQRRLAGALVEPLSFGAFLVTAAALLLLAGWAAMCWPGAAFSSLIAASRTGWGATAGLPSSAKRDVALQDNRAAAADADSSTRSSWLRLKFLSDGGTLLTRTPDLAMLALALVGILALAVPGTSALALGAATGAWLLSALVVLARGRFARGLARELNREPGPPREQGTQRTMRRSTVEPVPRAKVAQSTDELRSASDDGQIVQHLVRRQTETSEQIEGWLRCDFSPSQRTAALHVAFCPPLAALPTVEARIDPQYGAAATCKVADVYAHGARFEVRLASPAQQTTTVRLNFSAVVAQPGVVAQQAVVAQAASVHVDTEEPREATDVAVER